MINKILNTNPYSIMLKILGIGFLVIGIAIMFIYNKSCLPITCLGMAFGIIFIGIGEIINIIQKILDKKG